MPPVAEAPSRTPSVRGTAEPLFEALQLDVCAGGTPLLEAVSLELGPGELVTLTGASGCGKSTLLRTLAGLIDPAAGTVRLRGKRPEQLGFPKWRRRVVYAAQRPILLPGSARDNLAKPFEFRSSEERRFPEERAREALDRLALPLDRLDADARSLSEGQQQRIGLLRAVLLDPDVLLLDEPTSALDPETLNRSESFIRDHLAHSRGAALVVTHDPAQAERLGDAQIALDGYVVERGARTGRDSSARGGRG